MAKLSKAQRVALEILSAQPNHEGIAPETYLVDRRVALETLYELEDMYLLNHWSESGIWELTDAGRAALKEASE